MKFDQSFWLAVAFAIFVVLIARPVGRFIARGLDKRSARIKQELDEAMRLREEAQAVLALYQRKHKKAVEETEEILKHARDEAERIIKNADKKLEEEIKRRTEIAEQKIEQAEAYVLQEIRNNAVDISINAAKALIVKNMTAEAAESLMQNAVANMGKKLH